MVKYLNKSCLKLKFLLFAMNLEMSIEKIFLSAFEFEKESLCSEWETLNKDEKEMQKLPFYDFAKKTMQSYLVSIVVILGNV